MKFENIPPETEAALDAFLAESVNEKDKHLIPLIRAFILASETVIQDLAQDAPTIEVSMDSLEITRAFILFSVIQVQRMTELAIGNSLASGRLDWNGEQMCEHQMREIAGFANTIAEVCVRPQTFERVRALNAFKASMAEGVAN